MIGLGVALGLRSRRGGAVAPTKTYVDYQAKIATITPNTRSGSASVPGDPVIELRYTFGGAAATLFGSPYLSTLSRNTTNSGGSDIRGSAQHALPSQSVFNDQVASGREVVIRYEDAAGTGPFTGIIRNGLESFSDSGGGNAKATKITRIVWWNEADKKAYQYDPSTDSAVTEYPL